MMLNLVLFGPPGAGKGTQAQFLIEKYRLTHLSTGDLFRKNIKAKTTLGLLAKTYIDKGLLVPDEVTVDMLKNAVQESLIHGTQGFIFDGYPRNINQAEVLDNILNEYQLSVTLALALEVEDKILIARILNRGKTSGRSDDNDENTICDRIKVYYENTEVLKEYYHAQHKLAVINGLGSVEEIAQRLQEAIPIIA